MLIDWHINVETDDEYHLFEIEVQAECGLEWEDGEPDVELSGFFIEAWPKPVPFYMCPIIKGSKRFYFCATSPVPWMREFFLHIKEQLEADAEFIEAVVTQSGDDIPHHDPNEEHRLCAAQLL